MKRARLVLARETLARLSPDDLAGVNGASATFYGCPTGYTGLTVCGLCDPDVIVDPRTAVGCHTRPCTA